MIFSNLIWKKISWTRFLIRFEFSVLHWMKKKKEWSWIFKMFTLKELVVRNNLFGPVRRSLQIGPARTVRTSREPIKSKIVNGKSCWIVYNRIGVSQKKYFKGNWRCCQYKNQWIKCYFETLGRGKTSFILESWKHHIIQIGISHQIPIKLGSCRPSKMEVLRS